MNKYPANVFTCGENDSSGIYKRTLADGSTRYLARVRGADRKQVSEQFTTIRDAKAFIARIRGESNTGEYVNKARGQITLDEFVTHWLTTRVNLKENTSVRDENLIRNHILMRFGSRSLNSIVREDGQKLIAEMTSTHAPSTVRKVVSLFTSIMDEAVHSRRIKSHALTKLKLPAIVKRERRALSKDEVGRLADAIGPQYSPLIFFLSYSGLRIGEAAALRQMHLNRVKNTVRVTATLGEVQGRLTEHSPKTKAGKRTVVIPTSVMKMLPEGDNDSYVFQGPDGGPLRTNAFRSRAFNPAVVNAGLTPLRIHDLRGTYVSFLYASGASPVVVMSQVGHSDSRMALDAYASVSKTAAQQSVDFLENLLKT